MIQAKYDINFFSSESWDVDFLKSDDGGTAGGLTEREFEFEDANSNWRCHHCSCEITYLFKNWSRNPMTFFFLQWKLTCYRFRPDDRGTVRGLPECNFLLSVNGNIYLTTVRLNQFLKRHVIWHEQWLHLQLEFASSNSNSRSVSPAAVPPTSEFKKSTSHFSLEKKINVIACLDHFLKQFKI